jgi:hypothetical protein
VFEGLASPAVLSVKSLVPCATVTWYNCLPASAGARLVLLAPPVTVLTASLAVVPLALMSFATYVNTP